MEDAKRISFEGKGQLVCHMTGLKIRLSFSLRWSNVQLARRVRELLSPDEWPVGAVRLAQRHDLTDQTP